MFKYLISLAYRRLALLAVSSLCIVGFAKDAATKVETNSPLIFQDDFKAGISKWKISINDVASPERDLPANLITERITVVPAPDSPPGSMAARMTVPRALGTFRSEISQPQEKGFQERWYGLRLYVPMDWNFKAEAGDDVVMQWHAILGDELKAKKEESGGTRNFPVLAIAIEDNKWSIRRAFGDPAKSGRDNKLLDDPVAAGHWTAWVIHARWSSGDDGLIQIWKDGKLVKEAKGPNNYLVQAHTPYFKTGIYHPTWKKKNSDKFTEQDQTLKSRVIYSADVKIGNEKAKYEDVAPPGGK
jgi:hypothetical protein